MITITSKATGALLVFVAFATLVSGCDDGECKKGGLLGDLSSSVGGLLGGKKKNSGESEGLLDETGGLITDLLGGLDDTSNCKTCGESSDSYHNDKSGGYEIKNSGSYEKEHNSYSSVGKETSGSYQNVNSISYENDHNYGTEQTEKSTERVGKESSGSYQSDNSVNYENDHNYKTEQTQKSTGRVVKEGSGSYQNEISGSYENGHNYGTEQTEKSTGSVEKKSSGSYENDNSGSHETDNSVDNYVNKNDNYGEEQPEKSTGYNNREEDLDVDVGVDISGSYENVNYGSETEHPGNYEQKSFSSYEEDNDSHYESNLVVDLFTNLGAILEQIGGKLGLGKVISSLLDKEQVGGLIDGVNQILSSITGVECLPLLENNVLGSLLSAVSDLLVGIANDVDLFLQKLLQGKEGRKGLGNLLGGVGNLLSDLSNAVHIEELLADEEFKVGLKILLKGVNSLSLDESYEKSSNGEYH